MKTRLIRLASGVLAAAITSGAVVAVAEAQTGTAPPPQGASPMPAPGMHRDGMGGGHRMAMELDRLKTSLRLNATQAALWDRAQAATMPPADARPRMRAMHDRMTAMLDDPNFDPRKLAAEMDAADSQRRARMTAMRDAWFAVYDSLDPGQRGQVREFLRSRLGRGHAMEMHERMHGRMHDGMDGRDGMPRPPMPPAPPASR